MLLLLVLPLVLLLLVPLLLLLVLVLLLLVLLALLLLVPLLPLLLLLVLLLLVLLLVLLLLVLVLLLVLLLMLLLVLLLMLLLLLLEVETGGRLCLPGPVEGVRGDAGGGVVGGAPVGHVGAAGHPDDAGARPRGHLELKKKLEAYFKLAQECDLAM